jgi:iron complex outermembrane receptor protein
MTAPQTASPRRLRRISLLAAAASAWVAVAPAAAQTAPPASATDPVSDQVIVLSPFEVTAANDQGYFSPNTLAGTRLNSEILTTPSSVSIFNEEFIRDIGATTVLDTLKYSMAFNVTDSDGAGNSEQFFNGRISARGFPDSPDGSRDFFVSRTLADRYNTERVEFSRGPNSILFGIGNPGGIVNSVSKRARFQSFQHLELGFDSWGTVRGAFDINRTVIEDKLAVRLNLLVENRDSWREFEYTDSRRGHLSFTARPFESTTVRASYEKADIKRSRQRIWVNRDGTSTWVSRGEQMINFDNFRNQDGSLNTGAINTFINAAGGQFITGNRPVMVYQNGTLVPQNWLFSARSNGTNDRLPEQLSIFEPKRGLTAVNTSDHDFNIRNLFIEQRIGRKVFVEFAYQRENEYREIIQGVDSGNTQTRVDIAEKLPNGSPNPNFNRYFIETQPAYDTSDANWETFRLTASLEHDFDNPWLGRHRLAGLLQREEATQHFKRYFYANRTPLTSNRTIGANRLWTATYIEGNDRPFGERTFRADPLRNPVAPFDLTHPITGAVIGRVTPEYIQDRDRPDRNTIETWMVAGQSFMLKERLVLTYGYREDSLDQQGFVENVVTNANASQYPDKLIGELISGTRGPKTNFSGDTYSIGGAVVPVKWLVFTGNYSENFRPQTRFNIFNQNIGNVMAQGKDYSVRLNLWDGKVYLASTYYETDVVNEGVNLFSYEQRINAIWRTLETNGIVNSPTLIVQNGVYGRDYRGKGYEFELVANPSRNITLRANYTTRENVVSAVGEDVGRYLAENIPVWSPHSSLLLVDTFTSQTIGETITQVQNFRAGDLTQVGLGSNNHIKKRASFFGKYTFHEGRLKGFDTGLGLRYNGKRTLAYRSNGEEIEGPSRFIADLKFGYTSRFDLRGRNLRVTYSLNIDNVLNNDDWFPTRLRFPAETVETYNVADPRRVSLTTRFSF